MLCQQSVMRTEEEKLNIFDSEECTVPVFQSHSTYQLYTGYARLYIALGFLQLQCKDKNIPYPYRVTVTGNEQHVHVNAVYNFRISLPNKPRGLNVLFLELIPHHHPLIFYLFPSFLHVLCALHYGRVVSINRKLKNQVFFCMHIEQFLVSFTTFAVQTHCTALSRYVVWIWDSLNTLFSNDGQT